MVVGGWECGCVMLPCTLLFLLPLMPGFFMVPDRLTIVWPPEVHTALLECPASPFPNILRMCRACCNRMCGHCCVSTLSSRTRFLFHGRGCMSSFPMSLTGPSSSVFFVEKVDSLPLLGIQSEIYLSLCRLNPQPAVSILLA